MTDTSETDYRLLKRQLDELIGAEEDALANTANFVALLFHSLPRVNWVGVYVLRGDELVLGPFQGKPACVRLPLGSGVCGTAAAKRRSLRVDDVLAFEGHIACDPDSRSELVVPLAPGGRLVGVLDIDSPVTSRFSETDRRETESLCERFARRLQETSAAGGGFI